jgi:hypothetical protein
MAISEDERTNAFVESFSKRIMEDDIHVMRRNGS